MSMFDKGQKRTDRGVLEGLTAQIMRRDVREGSNYPINVPNFMPPSRPGMGPNDDPRLNTARAMEQQNKINTASTGGRVGSFLGGLAGTLIPVPVLGPAIGSAVGGSLGQLAGGVMPDVRDFMGYGASGAVGGLAGHALGGIAGQAGGYIGGRLGLSGLASGLGMNSEYDARNRYFVNPNNREIGSAY
ncbi:MAG: hypothetical protein WC098_06235 [Bacteroidales bacterium]|jgi:hypothetical protein